METMLVVGVETVAGANLAVEFAKTHHVIGLASVPGISLSGCDVQTIHTHDNVTVKSWLQQARPQRIVFCGQAAQACWDETDAPAIDDSAATTWARISAEHSISFTMLSSDAVFTGPWLSHFEDDEEHYCPTPRAQQIRAVEESVFAADPNALIVRTHVFGLSPLAHCPSLAERLLSQLERHDELSIDSLRHASPILAADLATLLSQCFNGEVCGLLHIAGGERTNPYLFAELLAEAAELERPNYEWIEELTDPLIGFGCSESTLNCSQARDLLEFSMPLLVEGVNRLIAQYRNGYIEKLRGHRDNASKAA